MAIKVRKRREDDEPPEDEEEQEGQPEPTEAQLEDEDPFVAGSMRTIEWLSEHPNVIVGFLIAFAVVAAAVYGGLNYMRGQAISASSGVSGALTAVANVGPGIGPVIGPAGSFAPLGDAAKLVISAGLVYPNQRQPVQPKDPRLAESDTDN